MKFFVANDSIARQIWGKGDTILFIFAGASAEFALNKAVDWLYFTGKLPVDPIGRLFSTVSYARSIVFAPLEEANTTIDKISFIHKQVEEARGYQIPDWSYRDVLFMLIHYSIASFELLERRLTPAEKAEVYNVFYRVGMRMQLKDLPKEYSTWLSVREQHLDQDLVCSKYTNDLFRQYRKHLGSLRYYILIQSQKVVVPRQVKKLLRLGSFSTMSVAVPVYKLARAARLDWFLKSLLLPKEYKEQIRDLDITSV